MLKAKDRETLARLVNRCGFISTLRGLQDIAFARMGGRHGWGLLYHGLAALLREHEEAEQVNLGTREE